MKIQVFEPPMCCSTGVCGPSVDPELVRFAADLEWLKRQGVQAERYSLSQQPAAFAGNDVVKAALGRDGNDCLPLILVDGAVAFAGKYPTREALAGHAGIPTIPSSAAEAAKDGSERSTTELPDKQLGEPVAKPSRCCCGPATSDDVPAEEKAGERPRC